MDFYAKARLKIAVLYFLLGVVILGAAGYLRYAESSGAGTGATGLATVIWLIVAMAFIAYLLADLTLQPRRKAMERQKRFIANISHELRTPLSVMRTNAEVSLLGTDRLTQAEFVEVIKGNLQEIDRMSKIIEFLLSFSTIEDRLTKLTFAKVNLVDVAKKAVNAMRAQAEEKKIGLTITGVPGAAITGNAHVLEEMIVDLLENALMTTPRGGAVRVEIAKTIGATTLSVRDTGGGMSANDVANIFEAFYPGENLPEKKNSSSVSLGLAIAREVALFHDAKISAKVARGKGTTISVRFRGTLRSWLSVSQAQ